MKLEHVALQVPDPREFAAWWCKNLGLTVAWRSEDSPYGHFLADDGGTVLLEVYRFEEFALPDYAGQHPRMLHIAFLAEDVPAEVKRLVAAGAVVESYPEVTPHGDEVAMLRDPWGVCVQLVKRKKAMLTYKHT